MIQLIVSESNSCSVSKRLGQVGRFKILNDWALFYWPRRGGPTERWFRTGISTGVLDRGYARVQSQCGNGNWRSSNESFV